MGEWLVAGGQDWGLKTRCQRKILCQKLWSTAVSQDHAHAQLPLFPGLCPVSAGTWNDLGTNEVAAVGARVTVRGDFISRGERLRSGEGGSRRARGAGRGEVGWEGRPRWEAKAAAINAWKVKKEQVLGQSRAAGWESRWDRDEGGAWAGPGAPHGGREGRCQSGGAGSPAGGRAPGAWQPEGAAIPAARAVAAAPPVPGGALSVPPRGLPPGSPGAVPSRTRLSGGQGSGAGGWPHCDVAGPRQRPQRPPAPAAAVPAPAAAVRPSVNLSALGIRWRAGRPWWVQVQGGRRREAGAAARAAEPFQVCSGRLRRVSPLLPQPTGPLCAAIPGCLGSSGDSAESV